MDTLKKIWPTPFKIAKKDVAALIIQIVILLVVGIVASVLIGVLNSIPIVKIFVGIVGVLVDLYVVVGIVLCVLKFLDIVK